MTIKEEISLPSLAVQNENQKNLNTSISPAIVPPTSSEKEYVCVDGNWAVAHVAYRTNDCAYIFPITPSSPMGEQVDEWASSAKASSAAHDHVDSEGMKLNLFGQRLKVVELQSEGGAAGALHGALVSGALATSFTASQGLLLFLPNLYKMAGELLPVVIHVAARALAGEALSIYGDHSDVMACRSCGWTMLSSHTVQEAHDMAVLAQVLTLNSRVPVMHFMDGFRTSHEINKIELVTDEQLKILIPMDKVEEHRQRSLSPMHPSQRGTAQSPDVFFQMTESSNLYYSAVENILEQAMQDFESVTGRSYHPYEYSYYGTSSPTAAIVTMGSSARVVASTLKYLSDENVCLIAVRMFRPWSASTFCRVLPASVSRVTVLDRTREGGSQGGPLYLDVCTSLLDSGRGSINGHNLVMVGGRYGLGSKDFTPRMVNAVIHNMMRTDVSVIQRRFTVGITDDVTNLSLSLGRPISTMDPNTVTQCVFWGFGSDGTVGANKEAIKMIGNYHQDMAVQAYFEYDAKKSSGWTVSHLRFSSQAQAHAIDAPFCIEEGQAGYVACHNESYIQGDKFDVVKSLKRRGIFFLNTSVASIADPKKRMQVLEEMMSPKLMRKIALKNIRFYIMDAGSLASKFGLAGRINMICMCVFFRLSNVIPLDDAIALLRVAIKKNYAGKGEVVVKKNLEILDTVVSDPDSLIQITVPQSWRSIFKSDRSFEHRHIELIDDENTKRFMTEISLPVTRMEGDDIPVSTFLRNNLLGGVMIPGTTKYEKRSPNPSGKVPVWEPNNCTQCNQCVFVCPHAAIRPFIVTRDETKEAPFPDLFASLKAVGPELTGKRYSMQISVLDCTGCNACVEACPEAPKALKMGKLEGHVVTKAKENWNYASDLPNRGNLVEKYSVRGSQFQTPLMEFSGACGGCGETPYFKLLTQLFGERMVIANATGCSTIWGGSFPSNPYTVSKTTGRGPAWANSLFEDNAEYGLGMFSAMKHRRSKLVSYVKDYVEQLDKLGDDKQSPSEYKLLSLLREWLIVRDEKSDKCTLLFDKMKPIFEELKSSHLLSHHSLLMKVWSERDMFPKLSQWICGGDGWAYDIGFGGLDHIEAFKSNDVNVLVVDTEMYSNTGGQQSKATPAGASVKFAIGGKVQKKKNLGELFMTYEHVYVASVSLHDQAQTLQAMVEADQHNGPSIVIAYAPCIQQGVRPNGLNDMFEECKLAVESGYWPLYRFRPALADAGHNPFILDSKKLRREVARFLQRESRFLNLQKTDPKVAEMLWEQMNQSINHRMEHLRQLAKGYNAFDHHDEATVVTLFASETGTAARVARDFAAACPLASDASAMNDVDSCDLDGKTIVFFVATCGQGAMPQNGKIFYHALCERTEPFSPETKFMVFGLGDSSYFFFAKAAKQIEERMLDLGAERILNLGVGDDSAENGFEEGLHEWIDKVWRTLKLQVPEEIPIIVPQHVTFSKRALSSPEEDQSTLEQFFHSGNVRAVSAEVIRNDLLCSPKYNRDFRSIRISMVNALQYELGDALEIFPVNDAELVSNFLQCYSTDFGESTVIKVHAFGMDGELSLHALFTHVLDIFGKPTKHFLAQLATFQSDAEERAIMLDPAFLAKSSKETGMTIADALIRFRTAQPPLPALLGIIPVLKPRAYSIASAPLASPSFIELLVSIDTWSCNEGMRYGVTCNMLRKITAGGRLWCRIKAGSMEPPTPNQAVVCAGIGSGLAPHMAFLRDRVRAAEAGQPVASFSLFFGNRLSAHEFLFQTEFEAYQKKYKWFKLHTAFSRDNPAHKVYVQDLVASTDDARLLLKETSNGMLYVCGNRNLPKPLHAALAASFCRQSDDKEEHSNAMGFVEELFIHGRAQQEVW